MRRVLTGIALLTAIGAGGTTFSGADFGAASSNPGNSFSTKPDYVAPTVDAAVVHGGTTGYLRQGGSYTVYANVSDTGAPASGVADATANVSSLTSGATAVPLNTCTSSCSIDGVTYGYKSSAQTAGSPLPESSNVYTYSITTADVALNTRTVNGLQVRVDNTSPSVATPIIADSSGNQVSTLEPSTSYAVLAAASDAGSGLQTVSANLSSLTGISGDTALSLSACTGSGCTVDSVSYSHRRSFTTSSTLAAGTNAFSVTATDKVGNAPTTRNANAQGAATPPTVSAVTTSAPTVGDTQYVKAGTTYTVFATASAGSAAISSVAADMSAVGASANVSLTSCADGCGPGNAHNYSGSFTTGSSFASQGVKTYSVTASGGGKSGSKSGTVAADSTAPTIAKAVVMKMRSSTGDSFLGGVGGFIAQGTGTLGHFRVLVNATDNLSNVASVTANLNSVTGVAGTTALAPCTTNCVVEGTTYAWVSSTLRSQASLTAGATITVSATDGAGNAMATPSSHPVTVDNTAPTPLSVDTSRTNGGPTAGRLDAGDWVSLTWNDAMDPQSALADWPWDPSRTPSADWQSTRSVVITIKDGGSSTDTLQVAHGTGTPAVGVGVIDLGSKDYVAGGDATFSASTLTRVSDSSFKFTVGGTASGTGVLGTVASSRVEWKDAGSVFDRAGNVAVPVTPTLKTPTGSQPF